MNPPVRRSSLIIAALILELAACGGGADQAAKQAASAASAAELVAAQRLRGAVPATYAADLVKDLGSGLGKAERQLASGGSDAKPARDAARQLGRVLREMSAEIRADDHAGLRRSAARAHALGQALSGASARLGEGG